LISHIFIAIVALISIPFAWAAPQQSTALEQQLASIQRQHESVEKQLASVRRMPFRPAVAVVPLAPIATTIAVSEPILPSLALPQWNCPPLAEEEADDLIGAAASRQALSPALLRSVIKQESAFRPCAVSIKGAQGLMQLMPATAEKLGVTDPFDPRQNVEGGAAFLRQLLNHYGGDLKLALGAYNAGPGRVEASGDVPNISETQNYVSSILDDLGAAEKPEPVTPKKEDFRSFTLQLSLDPKQATKSSVQLSVGN
jgi:soluble lytic murein transglycosylase-like protein